MNTSPFIDISTVNLSRALRWHPQGLASWSMSDWYAALAGEVGELCEVVAQINESRFSDSNRTLLAALGNEIGDVYAYGDLFAQSVGYHFVHCCQTVPFPLHTGTIITAANKVAIAAGKLGDIVKKLNRVRDGLAGNRVTSDELHGQLSYYLGLLGCSLSLVANRAGMHLAPCVVTKFNAVSERMGFPEKLTA